MYDEWKTSPLTMVPYPDTPPVPPGATRGLRAAADMAGIAWPE